MWEIKYSLKSQVSQRGYQEGNQGRLGGSVKHTVFDFGSGNDLTIHETDLCIRLCDNSVEPTWDSLSPSLSK